MAASAASAGANHDYPRAIELYTKAVELNPEWPDGWWALGMLQYQSNAYPEARDAFTHLIELVPQSGPAPALRGLCKFETGEYEEALADIERGIAHGAADEPRNAGILRYHEALLLTRFGRFDESLHVYRQLANGGDSGSDLKIGAGLAGLRVAQLPSEIKADRQDLFSIAGEASLRLMAGDEAGSRRLFASLFQQYPSTPNAHFLYGYLLIDKDPTAAISELKRELEIDPANAIDASVLAWILLLKDEPANALSYAEVAATKLPALPSSQLVLGESLAETGDIADGIQHLRRALQLDPGNLEAHIALATAFSRSGQEENAWQERQQAVAMAKASGSQLARP